MEGLARGVIRALCERAVISGRAGTLEFLGTDHLDCMTLSDDLEVRWLSAEQSNSSLIIGDVAMVKLIRHIFPGIHPEVEMTRYLTKVGYKNTAPLLGEVARIAPDGSRFTLILVQGAIRNQGDAWTWMLTNLRRVLDDIGLTQPDPDAVDDMMRPLVTMAGTIGTRLGELHAALAQDTEDEDFQPLPALAENVELWRLSAVGQIENALSILADGIGEFDAETAGLAQSLLARRDALLGLAADLAKAAEGAMMIRNHGDFHLGQILIAEADAYIIDFEGEPARTLSQRRAKTIPLRDVAGLLRSLSYLAATAELENEAVTETESPERATFIRRFTEQAEQAFLEGYLAAADQSATLAVDPDRRRRMLDLYLLEKAAYEIGYEARNRPEMAAHPARWLCRHRGPAHGEDRMNIERSELTAGIDRDALNALVDGRHGDPFSILGAPPGAGCHDHPHLPARCRGGRDPRSRHGPGRHQDACDSSKRRVCRRRRKRQNIRLRIHWPDAVQETEDPYSFGLLLGDLDLHLIGQGTHYDLGRTLGARAMDIDGVAGVRFSVWAPNARRVSVVGDFNAWDGRRHPMRLRQSSGVWELFVPRLGPGDRYKFEILDRNGTVLPQKADPVARASEAAPATASIVASSQPFRWTMTHG